MKPVNRRFVNVCQGLLTGHVVYLTFLMIRPTFEQQMVPRWAFCDYACLREPTMRAAIHCDIFTLAAYDRIIVEGLQDDWPAGLDFLMLEIKDYRHVTDNISSRTSSRLQYYKRHVASGSVYYVISLNSTFSLQEDGEHKFVVNCLKSNATSLYDLRPLVFVFHLNDVNNHAPYIDLQSNLTMSESTRVGKRLWKLKVVDLDTSLIPPDVSLEKTAATDWDRFSYDNNTGYVQLARAVDYELDRVLRFEIRVSGHQLITSEPIKATDVDDPHRQFVYSILTRNDSWDEPAGYYQMESSTGIIFQRSYSYQRGNVRLSIKACEFVNIVTDACDYASVYITAERNSTGISLRFAKYVYEAEVNEHGSAGGTILFVRITSAHLFPTVFYHLNRDAPRKGIFNIDGNSGAVIALKNLDYENSVYHEFVVYASDGQYHASTTVSIIVADYNEYTPTFVWRQYHFSARRRRGLLAGHAKFTDGDKLASHELKILNFESLFRVNATGHIFLFAATDAYPLNEYVFQLLLLDNVKPKKNTTTEIHVLFPDKTATSSWFLVALVSLTATALCVLAISIFVVLAGIKTNRKPPRPKRVVRQRVHHMHSSKFQRLHHTKSRALVASRKSIISTPRMSETADRIHKLALSLSATMAAEQLPVRAPEADVATKKELTSSSGEEDSSESGEFISTRQKKKKKKSMVRKATDVLPVDLPASRQPSEPLKVQEEKVAPKKSVEDKTVARQESVTLTVTSDSN